jgi:hypothetical protein
VTKFEALIQDVERFYSSAYNGAKRSAERVVYELQQEGPSWTGVFSNSWQISEGQTTVSGNGVIGEPRKLTFPTLPTTPRKFVSTDAVVFSIVNTANYRELALDKEEGIFRRPSPLPKTELGRRKFYEVNEGRIDPSKRWDIGGGNPTSSSSRTAAQDWYSNYVNSGNIQRIIKSELSTAVRRLA